VTPVDCWVCTTRNQKQQLVVQCAQHDLTAHEVRAFAARKLGGAEPQSLQVLPADHAPPEIPVARVRWVGNDYAPGHGVRRLQEKIGKKWRDV
jgi:hypothetical protein